MEKVKIKSAIDSGKKTVKGDKPVINIVLEDGRVGAGFDEKFKSMQGQEVEIEIKEAKEFNGVKQYWFNLPGENKGGGKGSYQKDWAFEKKNAALGHAISSVKVVEIQADSKNIIAIANLYFEFLNSK